MAEEYEAIVDMCNMGFLHVQRQFELTFKETSACFPHCFGVRPGSFYDHHKIISVTAVRYCRYPLSVQRKYKTLRRHKRRSEEWLHKMKKAYPRQFAHWQYQGVQVG